MPNSNIGDTMEKAISCQSKVRIKRAIENLLGLHIMRRDYHGYRDCSDIEHCNCRIAAIFDVGANIGQSALKFRIAFPKAKIYCFEPIGKTFEMLKENTKEYANLTYHQIALGSREGEAEMYLTEQSNASSLIRPDTVIGREVVALRTIDGFASDNKIERIDILKIDAEGFDLEVLKGARNMLSSRQIAFVLTEVGFHPGDDRQVLFDDIRSYLLPMGYAVFGVYDQQLEWSGEKRLRYANVCFVREDAILHKG